MSVMVCGTAKASENSVVGSTSGVISVVLLIDTSSDRILDADWTAVTPLGREFVVSLLRGRHISDLPKIAEELEMRALIPTIKPIIRALHTAVRRYLDTKDTREAWLVGAPEWARDPLALS